MAYTKYRIVEDRYPFKEMGTYYSGSVNLYESRNPFKIEGYHEITKPSFFDKGCGAWKYLGSFSTLKDAEDALEKIRKEPIVHRIVEV